MTIPHVTHLGAEHSVTGSCHLLQANDVHILVDCGMAQGKDPLVPMEDWPVQPAAIDYLFLTHAHIDHIGRLPELIQKGFHGEILTTHATKALLRPMLADAMDFSDRTEREVTTLHQTIADLSWGFEYRQEFALKKGKIKFTLGRAGHILGSCFVCLEIERPRFVVIFSGDLGTKDTPLLPDPDTPALCDFLILESTYGDSLHEQRTERRKRLGTLLTRTLSDGGKVFIPAFALGRTQELLYELDRLLSDPVLQKEFPALQPRSSIPIYIDSPLGIEITNIYARLSTYWDKEAQHLLRTGDHPLTFPHLYAVETYRDHLELLDRPGPAVIIAGSGMCTGGRIIGHLKHGLIDAKNDLVFVGYQAAGTPGRDIITYSKKPEGYVYLDGERLPIRAAVHILSGYSAHADQQGLVEWVESIPQRPGKIKLVHGEPSAQRVLTSILTERGYYVAE